MADVEQPVAAGTDESNVSFGQGIVMALLRTLNGLAIVGRTVRTTAVAAGTAISRAAYPVKESCLRTYQEAMGQPVGRDVAPVTAGFITTEASSESAEFDDKT